MLMVARMLLAPRRRAFQRISVPCHHCLDRKGLRRQEKIEVGNLAIQWSRGSEELHGSFSYKKYHVHIHTQHTHIRAYISEIYIYTQICVYRYPDFPSTCKVLRIRSNTEWVLGIFGQPSGWMFFGSHVTYSSKDESAPWPILYTTKYELVMYRFVYLHAPPKTKHQVHGTLPGYSLGRF